MMTSRRLAAHLVFMIASARQRARRALLRLSLTESQLEEARRLLRTERRQAEAARELLAECRARLEEALARPAPDSVLVLELTVEERLLVERERSTATRRERSMAALLRPEQAARWRGLAPASVDDLLFRLGG